MAIALNDRDQRLIELIRLYGRIYRDANGIVWIDGHGCINRTRFERLLDAGALEPAHDTLFSEIPSQSYTVDENRVQSMKSTTD